MSNINKQQINIVLKEKKEFLNKLKESFDWHNIQAMGTEGGESLNHEEEIIKLIDLIKTLEQNIKDLERNLMNTN